MRTQVRWTAIIAVSYGLAAAGCGSAHRVRAGTLIASGVGVTYVGAQSSGLCAALDDWDGRNTNCDVTSLILGLGLTLLAVGLVDLGHAADVPAPPQPVPPPVDVFAEATFVEPPRTLPELPADNVTLGLARTARSAARNGNCLVARIAVTRIGARDPAYRAALVAGPALAGCTYPEVADAAAAP